MEERVRDSRGIQHLQRAADAAWFQGDRHDDVLTLDLAVAEATKELEKCPDLVVVGCGCPRCVKFRALLDLADRVLAE